MTLKDWFDIGAVFVAAFVAAMQVFIYSRMWSIEAKVDWLRGVRQRDDFRKHYGGSIYEQQTQYKRPSEGNRQQASPDTGPRMGNNPS